MKILVTGSRGQVARSLVERAVEFPDFDLECAARPDFDLTDLDSVRRTIEGRRPDLVVSAAAYTAVDRAEEEPDLARAVNVTGAAAVAEAAEEVGAPVIHLSTDYVFSGDGDRPWREDDLTEPKCVYGRTKLDGERAVIAANPRHVVVRTAWVYSPFGHNFVKTMLRMATERDEIAVVADQWGNPTSALDIAEGILRVATQILDDSPSLGLFHLAATGDTNWALFAKHILAASESLGGPSAAVRELTSTDNPTTARRPANSRLASDKFARTFGWQPPRWQVSSEEVVRRLLR